MVLEETRAARIWTPGAPDTVVLGDNLPVLAALHDGAFRVAYLDPPFNSGRERVQPATSTVPPLAGTRMGFVDRPYEVARSMVARYDDRFADYWGFLEPRLEQAWRVLADDGTLYLHLDQREVHYAKVLLDAMCGRDRFLNEIVWAYDYGGRSDRRWPAKHDTILVYVKDPDRYWFDSSAVDREPYMAPGLAGAVKAARGKLPTDVWWHTIVSPTGSERTGYPTQKPLGVLRRILQASTRPGDAVLDPFAGSGTAGDAARALGRRFLLIDRNPDAIAVMRQRLGDGVRWIDAPPA